MFQGSAEIGEWLAWGCHRPALGLVQDCLGWAAGGGVWPKRTGSSQHSDNQAHGLNHSPSPIAGKLSRTAMSVNPDKRSLSTCLHPSLFHRKLNLVARRPQKHQASQLGPRRLTTKHFLFHELLFLQVMTESSVIANSSKWPLRPCPHQGLRYLSHKRICPSQAGCTA